MQKLYKKAGNRSTVLLVQMTPYGFCFLSSGTPLYTEHMSIQGCPGLKIVKKRGKDSKKKKGLW